jgi:hypothetical protein
MKYLLSTILLSVSILINGQSVPELGNVNWLRSYDEAIAESEESGKPIFILFQEVPGCATCVNYGQNVLTDPLLVDAIENEFIPLAIFNNKGGADKKVLDKYNEPTWNNPVVRIVDTNGKDLTNRIAGDYSIGGVANGMQSALLASDKDRPEYLDLLKAEQARNLETTYYSMYCFWSGEAAFGDKEGVVASEPGWMSGKEVVKITYDPNAVSNKELDNIANRNQCSPIKEAKGYRIDKDPQYYLKQSSFKYLPLSATQKTRINAALKNGGDPKSFLSPSQLTYLDQVSKSSKQYDVLYDMAFATAWSKMESRI